MARLVSSHGRLSFEARRRGRPRVDSPGCYCAVSSANRSPSQGGGDDLRWCSSCSADADTAELLAVEPPAQGAGLSGRKVEYIRDLAHHVESGELELDRLAELSDEEVIAEISAIHDFGVWSAQMFLMFQLERPDVLPTGDLGIRRAVEVEYGLDELPAHDELTRIAEPWRQTTLACIYLPETLRVPV